MHVVFDESNPFSSKHTSPDEDYENSKILPRLEDEIEKFKSSDTSSNDTLKEQLDKDKSSSDTQELPND